MSYQIEDGTYGHRLVLTSAWDSEAEAVFRDQDCKELELNYAKGWKRSNLGFLLSLDGVLALHLTDRNLETGALEPIHSLRDLRNLHIATYCKSEIRFAEFPMLEIVSLDEWRPRAKSLLPPVSITGETVNFGIERAIRGA